MTSRQKRPSSQAGEQEAEMAFASTADSTRKCGSKGRNPSGTVARKTSLPAAHEVKELRAEAQKLEHEFTGLCAKWKAALPDRQVLLAACTAAKQKVITGRVEQLNHQLKDELLQQQLYFSSLQQKVTEAPLWSSSARCQAFFDQMHEYVHLVGSNPESRKQQLQARFESGIRRAPELVERFTRECVSLSLPMLPYSRTSTAATTITSPLYARGNIENGGDTSVPGTLVSNVFVCKVSAIASIPRIYQTLVDNLKNTAIELERRLGVLLRTKYEIKIEPSAVYSRVERQDGEMRGAHTNRVWVGKLVSDDLAVIVKDFVDEDDEEAADATRTGAHVDDSEHVPVPGLRIDTCMMLTIARVYDSETQAPIILVRRVRVHRYNLPPSSPVMYQELKKLLSYYNGDFHVAILCDAYKKFNSGDSAAVAECEIIRSSTQTMGRNERAEVQDGQNSHEVNALKLASVSSNPRQT